MGAEQRDRLRRFRAQARSNTDRIELSPPLTDRVPRNIVARPLELPPMVPVREQDRRRWEAEVEEVSGG